MKHNIETAETVEEVYEIAAEAVGLTADELMEVAERRFGDAADEVSEREDIPRDELLAAAAGNVAGADVASYELTVEQGISVVNNERSALSIPEFAANWPTPAAAIQHVHDRSCETNASDWSDVLVVPCEVNDLYHDDDDGNPVDEADAYNSRLLTTNPAR